ncbi:hypothetical protein EGR_07541 [Echinococcus granulosus]|uniref:Uncharacterized protein n=1 Tax=Echinococcus granulosus TaxID=6210 RepID=W6UVW4_ECHGR|nr:hypothetical protein EGR_07541 [Echinococcus granulosus]EUB57599.1 hypothetical protein EGR_07541 [Echinococcus granulosus]
MDLSKNKKMKLILKHAFTDKLVVLLRCISRREDQPWQKHSNGDSDRSPDHHSKEYPEGWSFRNEVE